jgi:hypothetical protein
VFLRGVYFHELEDTLIRDPRVDGYDDMVQGRKLRLSSTLLSFHWELACSGRYRDDVEPVVFNPSQSKKLANRAVLCYQILMSGEYEMFFMCCLTRVVVAVECGKGGPAGLK